MCAHHCMRCGADCGECVLGLQPTNQMDGAKFVKLCKDCGIVDKKFTTTVRSGTYNARAERPRVRQFIRWTHSCRSISET